MSPEQVADKLTPLQRQMLTEGCACGTADEMVELGLWKPEFPDPSPYYLRTDLGEQVARILEDRTCQN
jgi:hypothetical protein